MVTMVATLGAFGSALLLRRISHQPLTLVILCVVLALSLSRTPARSGRSGHIATVIIVPLVALAAGSLAHLLLDHPNLGAVAFVGALSLSMWLRQFGPRVAQAARLLSLPITSILVVPAIGVGGGADTRWWQMAAALIVLAWVAGVGAVAASVHLGHRAVPVRPPAAARRTTAPSHRLSGHTRMAAQMAVGLTGAFIVGRIVFPLHWNWAVLTATIVCGGGPSRGEVVMKGAARLAGAGVGTVLAMWLASLLPGHHTGSVVCIFVLLFIGSWWREMHYAVWAACVTCVMALLTSYLGATSTSSLLATRLEAIGAGAACAIVACAVVLPVSTTAIVRRRRADALAALGDVVRGLAEGHDVLTERLAIFDARTAELRRTVRPLTLQRLALSWAIPPDERVLASVTAVMACRQPTHDVVRLMLSRDETDEQLANAGRQVARNIGRVRQVLAGVAGDAPVTPSVVDSRLGPLNDAVLAIA